MLILWLIICGLLLVLVIYQLRKRRNWDGFWVLPNSTYDYLPYYFGIGILILALVVLSFFYIRTEVDSSVIIQDQAPNPLQDQDTSIGYGNSQEDIVDESLEESNRNNESYQSQIDDPFKEAELTGPFTVDKVIDGDTIRVFVDGISTKVRFIWINTPELGQCYSYPAKDYVNSLVWWSTVYLETDSTQWLYDKYNRILAYVYTKDKENLNARLVAWGYALEYTYNLPYKYQKLFKQYEFSAYRQNLWLWNDCR